MSDFSLTANPFAQLIAPQELVQAIEASTVLRNLRRHTVLQADKPRMAAELAAFDAQIDAADMGRGAAKSKR